MDRSDPMVNEDDGEPWCKSYDAHLSAHDFCIDHQAAWCRTCDGECPYCVTDPHCQECHAALHDECHEWDCLYADD
jgi:hypothetical protein